MRWHQILSDNDFELLLFFKRWFTPKKSSQHRPIYDRATLNYTLSLLFFHCFFPTVIDTRSRGSLLVLTGIKREFWGVVSSSCTCYKGGNRSTLEIYFNLIDRRWRDKCPSYFSSPTKKRSHSLGAKFKPVGCVSRALWQVLKPEHWLSI